MLNPQKNSIIAFNFYSMQYRLLIILFLGFVFCSVQASDVPPVDSILNRVFEASDIYSKKIKSYDADVYMRALVETKKKNFLYRYSNAIPNFVLHDVKNDEAVIETVSKIKFKAPNSYLQNVNFVAGTLTKKSDIALLPLKFLSMDVYEETVPGESFYLPLRKKTSSYYEYILASVKEKSGRKFYSISYKPKYKNPQLLEGFFLVEDETWRVVDFNGKSNDLLFTLTFDIQMGNDSINSLLPEKFYIFQSYKYLGNHVLNRFTADLSYSDVQFNDTISNGKMYHLGPIYRVKLDSVPLNNDSVLWDQLRTFPLTGYETLIVENHKLKEAEARAKRQSSDTAKGPNVALEIAKNMVMNTRYKHKSTTFAFSGLLNPAMIGYSTYDGLAYKQSFNLNFDLERQQSIIIKAYAGYLFKRKQLQYQLSSVWNYEPWKLGYVSISAGRGNPTYSSRFLNLLQDSLISSVDLTRARYRDYYLKIYNSIELTNGFQFGTGIDYHIREPINSGLELPVLSRPMKVQYHFVPKISITWTPGQYYVTDGIQKVNVRSDYPTFKVEYAQSLRNVLKGNSSYSKVEFDISQNIRFDLMRKLNYHAGFGVFANQKDEYFNDFTYFAKNYFPETWGDGIGGGFNILPYVTYNSSQMYAQAHVMYETPSLMLTRLSFLSRGVARERLYVSQLYLPSKKSFTEVGYGIGNRFLNAAFFVAFDGFKFFNIGGNAVFLL